MKLNNLTIVEARAQLNSGEITSVELTRACLDRIAEIDSKLHACLSVCADEALHEAEAADVRIKSGERGDLLGIPYLAKDNIMTKGLRTTAASKILENYVAPFDATIIKRLKGAGAVLLGKTNLDEFAHGASTENSAFGPTRNPWDTERVAGGSSGGSAAAVAADMCIFAIGTDTGGSIRCPSSFCGVAGLKPTYGRNSRFGLLAMTSSTDVPGPIAKTVEDAAVIEKFLAGIDPADSTTVDREVDDYRAGLEDEIKGMRIGLPKEFFTDDVDPKMREKIDEAIAIYKEMGAEFVEVDLPHTKYGVPVYYIITPSEISSNLARFDGIRYGFSATEAENIADVYKKSRGRGFGPEAKRRIMLGSYALSAGYYDAYYLKAQKVRTIIKDELDRALEQVDCLLTLTQPTPAFKLGENTSDPIKMYLEDIFVTSPSLAGLPAITLPCGFVDGLPVGMQLIGRRFGEATILRVGHQYQLATTWHREKAKI